MEPQSPLGRIMDSQWSGLDPAQMGLGPVHAATPILQRQGLGLNDLDAWEINETFAAQVLACIEAWKSEDYCREQLGLPVRSVRWMRTSSTSTAAPLRSGIRSVLQARIVLHCCRCCVSGRQARHRVDLHRWWPRRRHAGQKTAELSHAHIGIVVDSCCDLPKDFIDEHKIVVVPITLRIGELLIEDRRDPARKQSFIPSTSTGR